MKLWQQPQLLRNRHYRYHYQSSNNSQNLNYENDTYQTEETRYNNNHSQIYNGNQEQANE
jgi:hypothetical protein